MAVMGDSFLVEKQKEPPGADMGGSKGWDRHALRCRLCQRLWHRVVVQQESPDMPGKGTPGLLQQHLQLKRSG
jgi:hypothetical protein